MPKINYKEAEVLMSTGEGEPLDEGGGFIFEYKQVVLWQFWDEPHENDYQVYTALVPEAGGVMAYYSFADPEEIESGSDYSPEEIEELDHSDDVGDRGLLVEIIKDNYGPQAVDLKAEGEGVTRNDLERRWAAHLEGEEIDDDVGEDDEDAEEEEGGEGGGDFVIRQDGDEWVVARPDGDVIETFSGHEEALVFIAEQMLQGEPGELYWENEKGQRRVVEGFDPELFLEDGPRKRPRKGKSRGPRGRSVGKYGKQPRGGPKSPQRGSRRRRRRRLAGWNDREFRGSAKRLKANLIDLIESGMVR